MTQIYIAFFAERLIVESKEKTTFPQVWAHHYSKATLSKISLWPEATPLWNMRVVGCLESLS